MWNGAKKPGLGAGLAATLLVAAIAARGASAETPGAVARDVCALFHDEPLRFFFDMRVHEAVVCSQDLLRREELSVSSRNEILATLGTIYFAQRKTELARSAFLPIILEDSKCVLPFGARMPNGVVEFFYGLRDETWGPLIPDIRTVAVGTIEVNAITSKGDLDLDAPWTRSRSRVDDRSHSDDATESR